MSSTDKDRVWKRLISNGTRQEVKEDQTIGCLTWNLSGVTGYGTARLGDKKYPVHRIAYWIHSDYDTITDIPKKNTDDVDMNMQ